MIVPEQLYALTPTDSQKTRIELVQKILTNTQSNSGFNTPVYAVPLGFLLILQSAFCRADAGSGQTVVQIALNRSLYEVPGGIGLWVETQTLQGARMNPHIRGHILAPGINIWATGNFSAATNPNTITLHLDGILIPVGNVVR